MSAVLNDDMVNDEGGPAAQTGNLIHSAAAAFHRAAASMGVEARTAEGAAALEAARQQFPDGNVEVARKTFEAYAADEENIRADCAWIEQEVRLDLAAAPGDPTGEPIVILGHLDQVRRDKTGRLRLWDIKHTSASGKELLDNYAVQQACYVLAARQTLAVTIEPGGLIHTPSYEKKYAKKFLRYTNTVAECMILVTALAYTVSVIRSGVAVFRPGADTCKWCKFSQNGGKGHHDCLPYFRTSY